MSQALHTGRRVDPAVRAAARALNNDARFQDEEQARASCRMAERLVNPERVEAARLTTARIDARPPTSADIERLQKDLKAVRKEAADRRGQLRRVEADRDGWRDQATTWRVRAESAEAQLMAAGLGNLIVHGAGEALMENP